MRANIQVISEKTLGRDQRTGPDRRGGPRLASLLAALAASGWLAGASHPALAAPQQDRVFKDCTFNLGLLQAALTISGGDKNALVSNNIEASYILIYVRPNPSDGQALDAGGFTGPVLCANGATDSIEQTTETTPLPVQPDATSVDVLGGEQAFHLRYEVNGGASDGQTEKRVCHTTDAGVVDCFLVQPQE